MALEDYTIGLEKVVDWPFVDKDVTITWSEDLPVQIETSGLGRTKIEVLNWSDYSLQSIATVII